MKGGDWHSVAWRNLLGPLSFTEPKGVLARNRTQFSAGHPELFGEELEKPLTIGSYNMASADERFYNLPLFVYKALGSRTTPRDQAHTDNRRYR